MRLATHSTPPPSTFPQGLYWRPHPKASLSNIRTGNVASCTSGVRHDLLTCNARNYVTNLAEKAEQLLRHAPNYVATLRNVLGDAGILDPQSEISDGSRRAGSPNRPTLMVINYEIAIRLHTQMASAGRAARRMRTPEDCVTIGPWLNQFQIARRAHGEHKLCIWRHDAIARSEHAIRARDCKMWRAFSIGRDRLRRFFRRDRLLVTGSSKDSSPQQRQR